MEEEKKDNDAWIILLEAIRRAKPDTPEEQQKNIVLDDKEQTFLFQ